MLLQQRRRRMSSLKSRSADGCLDLPDVSHLTFGIAITAASATPGCPMARFSISMVLIHSPPDLTTSLERSVSWT